MRMKKNKQVLFSTVCIYENCFYFYSRQLRRLCRVRMVSQNIEVIKTTDKSEQFLDIVVDIEVLLVHDRSIYMLQMSGENLIEYNVEANTFCKYPLYGHWQDCGNFAGMINYNDKLFMFARNENGINCFDTKTKEVMWHAYETEMEQPESTYMCVLQDGKRAYLFDLNSNRVLEFDLETMQRTSLLLPLEISGCYKAFKEGESLLLIDANNRLFNINNNDKPLLLVELNCLVTENKNRPFFAGVTTDLNIWILPNGSNEIYTISKENKKIKKYIDYPEDFTYLAPAGCSKYYGYCEDLEHYYWACFSANYMLCINKKNGEAKWLKPLEIDDSVWKDAIFQRKSAIKEKDLSLNEFLSKLMDI